jgi:hypothetical protein
VRHRPSPRRTLERFIRLARPLARGAMPRAARCLERSGRNELEARQHANSIQTDSVRVATVRADSVRVAAVRASSATVGARRFAGGSSRVPREIGNLLGISPGETPAERGLDLRDPTHDQAGRRPRNPAASGPVSSGSVRSVRACNGRCRHWNERPVAIGWLRNQRDEKSGATETRANRRRRQRQKLMEGSESSEKAAAEVQL